MALLTKNEIHALSDQLDKLIQSAIKKVGASKENDICHYLPGDEGYIHHFTMKKMKKQEPQKLQALIDQFIIKTDSPEKFKPKQRAPRGTRKKKSSLSLSKELIERMIAHAREAGDYDLVRELSPRRDLKSIKKELISSIRQGKVQQELWQGFVEAVSNHPVV